LPKLFGAERQACRGTASTNCCNLGTLGLSSKQLNRLVEAVEASLLCFAFVQQYHPRIPKAIPDVARNGNSASIGVMELRAS